MTTRSRNTTGRLLTIGAMALLGATTLAGLGGCRGDRSAERPRQFFPDMDDQPKYKAQSESPVFADGRSMRLPVEGVVAFGSSTDANDPERRWINIESDAVAFGLDSNGTYLDRMPLGDILGTSGRIDPAQAEEFVRLGQEKYNIFCYPCHGATGDGQGIVGKRWASILPSYHIERFQRGGENGADGYIFHTIRNGLPNTPGALPALKMPAYGDRVSVEEAWAIVAYIRALQKTQQGELRDVPESVQQGLLATRGAAARNTTTNEEPAP